MRKLLKGRGISPSMIVAMVALFVALGPSAYATHLVVNGSDVTDGSLTGDDVRGRAATSSTIAVNGGLTGHDISGQQGNSARGQPFVAGSLTGWDVADSSLGGPDIADGTIRGPDVLESTLAKVPDADRLDGMDSSAFLGVRGAYRRFELGILDSTSPKGVQVFCDAGHVALGGGFTFGVAEENMPIAMHESRSIPGADGVTPVGWAVWGVEVVATDRDWRPTVNVVCAPAG